MFASFVSSCEITNKINETFNLHSFIFIFTYYMLTFIIYLSKNNYTLDFYKAREQLLMRQQTGCPFVWTISICRRLFDQRNGVLCMNIGTKKTKFNSCYFLKNYLISKSIKEHAHDWYINWSAKQIFLSLKILGGLLRIRKTGVSIICTNKNLVQQHVFFRWSC